MARIVDRIRAGFGLPQPVFPHSESYDLDRLVRLVEKRAILIAQVLGAMTAASFLSLSVFAARIDQEIWRCLWQNFASDSITNSLAFVALMIFTGAAGLFYLLLLSLLGPKYQNVRRVLANAVALIGLVLSVGFWAVLYYTLVVIDVGLSSQCA